MKRSITITLAAFILTAAPAWAEDCNDNGVEDAIEIGPIPGTALLFNGVDEYVDVGLPFDLPHLGEGDFTLEMWVWTTDMGRSILIGNYDGEPFWNLEIHSSTPAGHLRFAYADDTTWDDHHSVFVADGGWHHVAAVRTLGPGGYAEIFVDGNLVYDEASESEAFTVPRGTMIGRDPRPDSHYLDGALDEVRVWNIARDGTEIAADMYSVLEGTEPGLKAYWRFEEGSGETAHDSARGNDGTLVGPPTWIPIADDCNENGIPDECEIGGLEDCNTNGVPDLCDIFDGTSQDCNANGVPDECEPGGAEDCNNNGVSDLCDIYVGTSDDTDGDGIPDECETVHNVTQGTIHPTIQEAIDLAVAGNLIEVGPGTYVERINLLGKAITLRSTDGPSATTIDGNGDGSVITCTDGEGPDTVIEGFTVTHGGASYGGGMYNAGGSSATLTNCTFSGNVVHGYGGGMYNSGGSSPTLTNCTFTDNSALNKGGGMYNSGDSHPTLTNCTFTDNSASYGGGMYNPSGSHPTLTNCTFSGNSADAGGGMLNESSSPTLTNCTFSGNVVQGYGGGMYNSGGSSPTLTNCTFTGNSADYVDGGAMCNSGSSPTLTDCTFSDNWAGGDGGGMANLDSSTTLTNCTFSGNSADYHGGGMDNYNNSPTLTNCTFSGNAADYGGGMRNYNSNPTLTNCTFSGNSANDNGGGMRNHNSSPTLTNCILWGNAAPTGPQIFDAGFSTTTATYSCIQGGWTGTGNIDADPVFARNPNDGGDGWGDDPDTPDVDEGANDDYGDLHLLADSPCIDAADNSAVPADALDLDDDGNTTEPIPFDLDLLPRFVDDARTLDSGAGTPPLVDMGAYEYRSADLDLDYDVDLDDGNSLFGCLDGPGVPCSPDCNPADLDGDGDCDLSEFALFQQQFTGPQP